MITEVDWTVLDDGSKGVARRSETVGVGSVVIGVSWAALNDGIGLDG
jgi:hypothetical protein